MNMRVQWGLLTAAALLCGCGDDPTPDPGDTSPTTSSASAGSGGSGGAGGAGSSSSGTGGDGGSKASYGDVLAPAFLYVPFSGHLLDLDADAAGHIVTAAFDPSVIEVTDIANVHDVGVYDEVPADTSHGRYHWVSIDGKDMLSTGTKATVHRFEIQPDGSLVQAATWPWSNDHISYGSDLEGDRAYVCNALDGVSIRDRETLQTELGVIPAPDALDITVQGSTAYVLDRQLGLTIWDVNDPASPKQTGALPLKGGLASLVVEGTLATVSASTWVHLVDLANPEQPALLSSIRADAGVAVRADIEGNVLVFADYNAWPVYDITNPKKPVFVGQEDAFDAALSVKLVGKRAYFGDWGYLRAYDIDLTARAPEIDFAWPLYAGAHNHDEPLELVAVISNKGTEPLVVSDIVCPRVAQIGPKASPTSFTVNPGEAAPVTLTFDVAALEGDKTYECVIHSDDPDEPTAPLPIELEREGLNAGDPAPVTVLPDLDGTIHDLQADYAGKVVYVHLFSTNCQQCVTSMATVQEQIQEAFGSDPRFFAVALHSSVVGTKFAQDPAQLALITEGYGLTHEQVWCDWNTPGVSYYDWEIKSSEAYAPYPRHYVVGPDGVVKYASYEADLSGAVTAIKDELAKLSAP